MYAKKEKIYPAYVVKHNWLGCEGNSEGRLHYLAAKKLSALLRGITSKYHGDFYYLDCPHSFATEKKT